MPLSKSVKPTPGAPPRDTNLHTDRAHVRAKGSECPRCRKPDVTGGPVETGDGEAYQEMGCGACGFEWTDLYTLTGYR